MNRCETVPRCESNSAKTDAGEEFVFVEPCLASISWCWNRVFDKLDASSDEDHVSPGFGAVPDVVPPLMAVQEDVQNKRGSESDTTEDANVNEDTAVEMSLPRFVKETVEVDELPPFERVQQPTVEVPMLRFLKETVEVDQLVPFERIQQPTVQVPMPQILKETVEVVELAPRERVQQIVEMPILQILKETVYSACTSDRNVAPTRAVTFDETAPVIKYVAPAVSNREEEVINVSRFLGVCLKHAFPCLCDLDVSKPSGWLLC